MLIPLTESELREIADLLDKINESNDNEGFVSDAKVGRIEVNIEGRLVGHLVPCDDWWGFEPFALAWGGLPTLEPARMDVRP